MKTKIQKKTKRERGVDGKKNYGEMLRVGFNMVRQDDEESSLEDVLEKLVAEEKEIWREYL